jgi:hypothetical protein
MTEASAGGSATPKAVPQAISCIIVVVVVASCVTVTCLSNESTLLVLDTNSIPYTTSPPSIDLLRVPSSIATAIHKLCGCGCGRDRDRCRCSWPRIVEQTTECADTTDRDSLPDSLGDGLATAAATTTAATLSLGAVFTIEFSQDLIQK